MAHVTSRLTKRTIDSLSKPGTYADGGGLVLRVKPNGGKFWVMRYSLNHSAREMGLGSVRDVSLKDAREAAGAAHKLLAVGLDPLAQRKAEADAQRLDAARAMSFRQCAEAFIKAHSPSWKNPKHRQQWPNSLRDYAFPIFGDLPVADIDTGLVLKALEPIWSTKRETAGRVRGRIEAVLDWAIARGYRQGPNPALWRGHLAHLLATRSKATVKHHPALPYADMPAFMMKLRERKGSGARCLEFVILTAARSGEARGATWDEIDLDAAVWIVPGSRMKAGKEHRVPLSDAAIALLKSMAELREGTLVFPSAKRGKPISDMTMGKTLKGMDRPDITAHGFRSTFRDWVSEQTSYPGEMAEMALAHTIGNKVEAAYRRGDLFEKRRRLMADWADYCSKPRSAGATVTPIRAGA
ncbi:MAG: integrase arm-type DNA-binding domain-containing protein [Parvibaculum sp.]|uniref:tyrosine-type recombinase/integrase n=1 Tax=Parvibaculum sp. TaxID=2024848 RepID=UPI002846F45A|nr:integrase arm-type DNA-binding domain-containing protein [Parvibaculum sp.]MDR3499938.1 integrase arm-type DNA-binding domain-containing protein [Parvibaculum sp.]